VFESADDDFELCSPLDLHVRLHHSARDDDDDAANDAGDDEIHSITPLQSAAAQRVWNTDDSGLPSLDESSSSSEGDQTETG